MDEPFAVNNFGLLTKVEGQHATIELSPQELPTRCDLSETRVAHIGITRWVASENPEFPLYKAERGS